MNTIRYIIGLGNPEPKYDHTPHNIGRDFVNALAEKHGVSWRKHDSYEMAQIGGDFVLVRPLTYMNLSGQAAAQLLHFYKAAPANILVCVDDFDIALGQIRLRARGSAGTHNGMKSLIQHLNTQEFPRLRLGVGPIPAHSSAAQYVLAPFSKSERSSVEAIFELAAQAVDVCRLEGVESAMNRFNASTL